jgi:hypothetical protein
MDSIFRRRYRNVQFPSSVIPGLKRPGIYPSPLRSQTFYVNAYRACPGMKQKREKG